jgi:hypothetical protein
MVRRHDWTGLWAAGFAIPKVSLVRLDAPLATSLLGWRPLARRLALATASEAGAAELGRAYPNVESLNVTRVAGQPEAPAAGPGAASHPERSICVASGDPRAAWAAIVAAARGELLALLRPGESASGLGPEVAALMRTPALDGVVRRDGLRLVRRSALATIAPQGAARDARASRWIAPHSVVPHEP